MHAFALTLRVMLRHRSTAIVPGRRWRSRGANLATARARFKLSKTTRWSASPSAQVATFRWWLSSRLEANRKSVVTWHATSRCSSHGTRAVTRCTNAMSTGPRRWPKARTRQRMAWQSRNPTARPKHVCVRRSHSCAGKCSNRCCGNGKRRCSGPVRDNSNNRARRLSVERGLLVRPAPVLRHGQARRRVQAVRLQVPNVKRTAGGEHQPSRTQPLRYLVRNSALASSLLRTRPAAPSYSSFLPTR